MTDNEIIKYFNSLYIKLLDVKYDLKITQKEFLALNRVHNLITRQQAELERLTGISDNKTKELLRYNASIEELHKKLETAKAEAYKEFAEKLKERIYKEGVHPTIEDEFMCSIDNLLKEMMGENNLLTETG